MILIYKYPLQLTDEQDIFMPALARILSAGLDPRGQLCIWAAVNTNSPDCTRKFLVVGTECELPDPAGWRFLASVAMDGFMWHVFVQNLTVQNI